MIQGLAGWGRSGTGLATRDKYQRKNLSEKWSSSNYR
jgi:hypothetical protein